MSGVPSYIKLSPQMDIATLVNALNQNFNQVQGQDRRKIITDEDGNQRIVLGKQDDGTYAIRVAGDNANVGTATDDQLVMNSDWNMWKIIHSGNSIGMGNAPKRTSSITLNSSNVGYVYDICIPIRNLNVPAASIFASDSKPQVFVRNTVTKRDMTFTTNFYNDGTNAVDVHYSYRLSSKYLVVRTLIRWVKGSVTFTPNSESFEDGSLYWEVANPTRAVAGGMGGGGSPTGGYVFYDSVTMNPYTNQLSGYDTSSNRTTIAARSYSAVYSYTFQFPDVNGSYHFPSGGYQLFVIPAVDVDN